MKADKINFTTCEGCGKLMPEDHDCSEQAVSEPFAMRVCPESRRVVFEDAELPEHLMAQLRERGVIPFWCAGHPPKPWADEWFIAQLVWGARVVLKALPEEWTYDFRTADETYYMKEKIVRWMPFPDSNYVAPDESSKL